MRRTPYVIIIVFFRSRKARTHTRARNRRLETRRNVSAAPLQSDIDVLVEAFLEMARNDSSDEVERQNQRFAGLRGLRAYFALMDDHLSRLTGAFLLYAGTLALRWH